MKRILRFLCIALMLFSLQNAHALQPLRAPDGSAPRALLVVSGDYSVYQKMLQAIARGLDQLQIIDNGNVPIPLGTEDVAPVWHWLAENAGGDQIRFLEDGIYDYQWGRVNGAEVTKSLLERLKKKDAELIIVMGTPACRTAIANVTDIPMLTYASTNAVTSGLVKSAQDSGQDNVHALIEPNRFVRQVKIFKEIFGFQRLGFAYMVGQEHQYELTDVSKTCQKMDVDFFTCTYAGDPKDLSKTLDRALACVTHLYETNEIDALILPHYNRPPTRKGDLPDYLIQHGIPTFSVSSSQDFVAEGLLMGLDNSNLNEQGMFEANVLKEMLRGVKPRNINQIYSPQRTLVVNLTTAMLLGWNIPFDLFSSIGAVYKYHER